MKVDELTPRTGRVNMPVKVISLDEPRSKDNATIKQSVNLSDLEYEMPRMGGGRGRGGPRGKPSGRWGDLMKLKRETGNKKFFNRDEMTEEQIVAAIKEMGGE